MIDIQEAVMEAVPVQKGAAVEARAAQGVPSQGLPQARREARRAPLARCPRRRLLHDGEGRDGGDPGPERLGEVDAGPSALDAPPAGRRVCAHPRARRRGRASGGPQAREPRVRRGVLLQEDVGVGEPQLRRPLLRDDLQGDPGEDSGDPRARGIPARPTGRADGGALARDAAEGRARPRLAHVTGRPAPRRADDGARSRSKLEVQEFIREIRDSHDSTILLCTHDLGEAEILANRVASSTAAGCSRSSRRTRSSSATRRRRWRRRSSPRPAREFEAEDDEDDDREVFA